MGPGDIGKVRSFARRALRLRGPETPVDLLAGPLAKLVRRLPTDVDGSAERELFERVPGLLAEVERTPNDRLDLIRRVPAYAKVAHHHVRAGDADALHAALNAGLLDLRQHRTGVHDGRPVALLPGWDDARIARDAFVLAVSETRFAGEVVRARITDDRVEAVFRAGFRHIDADGDVPALVVHTKGVTATYVGETSGHRGGDATWRETYDRSTWSVSLPLARLGPQQTIELDVEISLAGRTERGRVAIEAPVEPSGPAVDRIDLDRGVIVVEGRGLSTAPVLRSPLVAVAATDFTHLGSRFRAEFPTTADRWGRSLPLPLGDYEVVAGEDALPLTEDLVDWPTDVADGALVGHTTTRGLRLIKPRRPDENTMYGQRALRAAYADLAGEDLQDAALFQCYWAEVATDSQAAIHRELRRRRPRMRLHWGVRDHSVAVPDGATPVVAGSREWYAALGSVRYLVKNTEVGAYTRLRPGQVYLQTFHGQPFKLMGRPDFARRMPTWRAEFEAVDRRSAFWDVVCLPYPEAADFYRDAYGWSGPAFDHGLPRTDGLLADDADEVRRRTRALLGIAEDQVAVLHATTWRDDLSTGDNTSADPGLLDVHALAARLGERFVVLQRSHTSVARSQRRVGSGERVVDVTDHPEINDLVLASDLAILDYSSLRFDYAITGKPMVFFVPDLDRYAGQVRGFLFDFAESAPGPLVRDARELPGLLTDTSWTDRYVEAYAAFNARFNAHHDGRAAERVVDGLLGWDG